MIRANDRIFTAAIVLFAAVLGSATPAFAQMQWLGRGIVTVSGGLQTSSQDVTTVGRQAVYEEEATLTARREIGSGPFFDVSAGVRVWRNLLVGIGYSRFVDSGAAAIEASIPHPLIFDQFRGVSLSSGDLEHSEQAIHLTGTWMIPVTDKIEVGVFGGPSFFTVKEAYVSDLSFSEVGAPFTSVSVGEPGVAEASESAVGFNIGADVMYLVTPRIGVNLFGRYTAATAKLDAVEGGELKAGGPQLGVGLRFRF
jgi:hypothetical protein